jgi:hypothetical protein
VRLLLVLCLFLNAACDNRSLTAPSVPETVEQPEPPAVREKRGITDQRPVVLDCLPERWCGL